METLSSWKSPKTILVFVGVAVFAGVLVLALLRDSIINRPTYQVNVTGSGRVSYEPDIAKVTFGVTVDRVSTAENALKQITERMDRITQTLKEAGIPEEDIVTTNYSITPHYEYFDQKGTQIQGYDGNQQVTVTIKDITADSGRTADIIHRATSQGSNQLLQVRFAVSTLEDLKQEARVLALQDAREKADSNAKYLGVRLGKIVGWSDNFVQLPQAEQYYGAGYGGGGSGEVPIGSQEIVVDVTVQYLVKK